MDTRFISESGHEESPLGGLSTYGLDQRMRNSDIQSQDLGRTKGLKRNATHPTSVFYTRVQYKR